MQSLQKLSSDDRLPNKNLETVDRFNGLEVEVGEFELKRGFTGYNGDGEESQSPNDNQP